MLLSSTADGVVCRFVMILLDEFVQLTKVAMFDVQ
jgi:hypothetical protein